MTVETKIGKITASERVLNLIAGVAGTASIEYREDGLECLACEAEEIFNSIYDALDETGFYKNIK